MMLNQIPDPQTALPLVITDAGRQAAVAANNAGLQLNLTEIALGRGLWQPDSHSTGLQDEIKRLPNLGGSSVVPDMLHLTITDDSNDVYALGEFGLYTDTGVLFALYSQSENISEKVAESILMISADMQLDTVPPGSVTIEGNNFQYPLATPEHPGILRDAPADGRQYLRQLEDWTPLVAFIPGMILMWAGTEAQVPEGWQLCNGQGTTRDGIPVPNLLNRMVMGAGSDYGLGQTGGATSATTSSSGSHSHAITVNAAGAHNHTVTVNPTTLSISQMPSHSHSQVNKMQNWDYGTNNMPYTVGGHTVHADKTGNHTRSTGGSASHTHTTSCNTTGSHTHTASCATSGVHTHTVSTLPPYYALAYIIKV